MNTADRKTILRKIPYGLYVMTSSLDGNPAAAVVSFVSQTSIQPPLVMTAVKADSMLYAAIVQTGYFALHLFEENEKDKVSEFFKVNSFDKNKINGYYYTLSGNNVPILKDNPMVIEVKLKEIMKSGDHHPVLGEVIDTVLRRDVDILTMKHTNWHYGG